eukprot:jgi/Chrpa1/22/Chrysochromulina_OHIO_Genome00000065-RA
MSALTCGIVYQRPRHDAWLREKLIPIEGKPGFYYPNKEHALRARIQGLRGQAVDSNFRLSASNGISVADQLMQVLAVNRVRVINLFKSFDANADGRVTRIEFHRAFEHLGYADYLEEVNELFLSLDEDGTGAIEFDELHRKLRQTSPLALRTSSASTSRTYSRTSTPAVGGIRSPRPPSCTQSRRGPSALTSARQSSSRASSRAPCIMPALSSTYDVGSLYDDSRPRCTIPIHSSAWTSETSLLVSSDLFELRDELRWTQAQRRLWASRRQANLSRLQGLRWLQGKRMPAGCVPPSLSDDPPLSPSNRPFAPAPPQPFFAMLPTEAIIDALVHERLEESLRALQTSRKAIHTAEVEEEKAAEEGARRNAGSAKAEAEARAAEESEAATKLQAQVRGRGVRQHARESRSEPEGRTSLKVIEHAEEAAAPLSEEAAAPVSEEAAPASEEAVPASELQPRPEETVLGTAEAAPLNIMDAPIMVADGPGHLPDHRRNFVVISVDIEESSHTFIEVNALSSPDALVTVAIDIEESCHASFEIMNALPEGLVSIELPVRPSSRASMRLDMVSVSDALVSVDYLVRPSSRASVRLETLPDVDVDAN